MTAESVSIALCRSTALLTPQGELHAKLSHLLSYSLQIFGKSCHAYENVFVGDPRDTEGPAQGSPGEVTNTSRLGRYAISDKSLVFVFREAKVHIALLACRQNEQPSSCLRNAHVQPGTGWCPESEIRLERRVILPKIRSASAVHTNALGSLLR
jgi:hypothetical protein